jgi:PAS domain S-box-containing protein
MSPSTRFDADGDRSFRIVWEDGERIFCRGHRPSADGDRETVLAVLPAAEHPTPASLDRLAHEYGLKDELDAAWALRPLELVRERGRTMLVLEDPGSEPLGQLLGAPLELGRLLHFAIGITSALGKAHRRGLVHKDIKPANIFVNRTTGEVRLTGFGIASRLLRERPALEPPETIAGTLAYMAPEQTGRMNCSIDARSDLYSVGITLYQILTGSLPFTASDPMEWVHCHIARKPMAPSERLKNIPAPVSHIIMKLLAKTAEERYQTAAGVERDLRRCLDEWEALGSIGDFPPGEHDTPDRLLIPEKLYGREREVETLLAAFDRIVKSGAPELVLVSGYSGIGKSSVVNELHKALVPPRGLFAAGKFDQYKRDIPYATLAQAFQSLVRPLLGKSDAELSGWRDALVEALGPNGQLMVDVVPELRLIVGDQPPVPELSPQDAQRRFQLVFQRFIGVFARAEHPLALFLDDLQWLDAATLDLLEDLLTRSELRHLLLIGAYRDNEVDTAHPLRHTLAAIRQAGTRVQDITLAPLARDHLGQMIADALRSDTGHAAPLADLVHAKTAGNPFFVIQFLSALAEEDLLHFEHDAGRWGWDLARIEAKGYTDNVVDLLVGRLHRLPLAARVALQQLACLGNGATIRMLAIVLGNVEVQVHADLWEAVRQELVLLLGGTCKFVHDRVQEAAYSVVPEASRPAAHLRIGRLLVAHTKPEQREEAIFEIVSQLNRGTALITESAEREQLAELNLLAGKRAKASMAYASALTYLTTGAVLLAKDCWNRQHELAFALELNRAECEFLTGALAEAEARLAGLSSCAADTVERATVACLRIDLYVTLSQIERAIAVGLDYLRHQGIEWSPRPTNDESSHEYERIWSQLGGRTIEELLDLPLMNDSGSLATLDVLTKLAGPAYLWDANLLALIPCRATHLSLERGNSAGSCFAYVMFGAVAAARFGDYDSAYRFGKLGCELVEQRGLARFQARTLQTFGASHLPWARHVRTALDMLHRAFEAANKIGELMVASFIYANRNTCLLVAGDPLVELEQEVGHSLAFARKMRFDHIVDVISAQLGLIRTLRGLTPTFGSLDDEQFSELEIERRFASNPNLKPVEWWYWTRKLQARFFAGDYASAIEVSSRAWSPMMILEQAEYHFYSALSRSAFYDSMLPDQRAPHRKALAAHHRKLELWAQRCPENFEDRAALVGAEIARLEGRELDAERLYEQAIRASRSNGFIHNEALANELAARFYAARGFETIAHAYLRNARYCYSRWGADGKVRQLDQSYPQLKHETPGAGPASMMAESVERLDLATVINVSQAVSGEVALDKLLDTLMRTAIEQAGAERGLLMLPKGGEPRIAAEATTGGDSVTVHLLDRRASAAVLPESVLHYVLRTQESVILDDATAQSLFAADPYIRRRQARSILCLPLLNRAKLIGVLYLENNLSPRVFAPARVPVLKLLASQAAIALESAHLYRDLEQREAKIRRLVDANIIGIYIWDLKGRIIEANDTFLHMVGYNREELISGGVRWTDLTPWEWRNRSVRGAEEMKMNGSLKPFEKEYFRKDGSRVPVLLGSAAFDERRNQGVAFVLDLSEQKRAEAEARESERRYREMQMEVAHANRVATMGQLTASIAHEVNQPITGAVTNAQAALRWLEARPPDLEEVRHALGRIVQDANRAGDVIGRIRDIVKKAPPRKDRVDINAAIREVIELTRGEAAKQSAAVQTAFGEGLPLIEGDRVQLQQVVLNLIVNAVQAMGPVEAGPRELSITTDRAEPSGVLVAVKDSGPGLLPANLEQLFAPFYTTKADGLGMGLSICRSIIEAHGGRLWVTANLPRGAIFSFTVPGHPGSAS